MIPNDKNLPKGNKYACIIKKEGSPFGTPYVCCPNNTAWVRDWDYGECQNDSLNYDHISEEVALAHVKRMREKFGRGQNYKR